MARFSNRTFKKLKFSGKKSQTVNIDSCSTDKCDANISISSASQVKLTHLADDFDSFLYSSNQCSEINELDLLSDVLNESVLCKKCNTSNVSLQFHRQVQGLATEFNLCKL